jgi:two-component system chemotaxis response regulator CheB
VDVLFRSVAEIHGKHTLAVMLTGMGSDGLLGTRALKITGATSLVQDEASSVVWGMPGAVAAAGLADQILALDRIPAEIVRLSMD